MLILMTKDASPTLVTDILNEFMELHSIKSLKKGIERCKTDLLYLHPDLSRFAEQAKKEKLEDFYVRPADPSKPYGKLERCEPEYNEVVIFNRFDFKIDLVKDKEELRNIVDLMDHFNYCSINKGDAAGLWPLENELGLE